MLIRTVRHTVGSYDIMLYIDLCEADNMLVDDLALELWSYGCQQHAPLDFTERICIQ